MGEIIEQEINYRIPMADGILLRSEAGGARETPALTNDEAPTRGDHWEPHDLARRRRCLLAELDLLEAKTRSKKKEGEARKQVEVEELLRARQEEEAKKLIEKERLEREEEHDAEVKAESGGARTRRADDDHTTVVAASLTAPSAAAPRKAGGSVVAHRGHPVAALALLSSGGDTEVHCDLG